MQPLQDDVLDRMGKVIGYTQVYLFTILLMYICYTFRTTTCVALPANAQSDVCLGTVALTLTMLALSVSLAVGISLRQAKYLRPWLIMSIVTAILIISYLTIYGNLFLSVMGILILFLVILSWYPSFKLHERYRSECSSRAQQGRVLAISPLYILHTSSSLPQYSEVIRDPLEPPAYEDVMGMDEKPLYLGEI